MRNQESASAGFSSSRSTARKSFTCAASTNLRPPYFTKGMLRLESSTSSVSLWWPARKRTACSRRGVPSSRFWSTRSQTAAACSCSSEQVVMVGLRAPPRCVKRFFVKRSAAASITALEASRMGWRER